GHDASPVLEPVGSLTTYLAGSDQETLLFNTVRLISYCGVFRGNYCLMETDFTGAVLTGAKFHKAICQGTLFCAVNLAEVTGLDKIRHEGPSHITTDSLTLSSGSIPERFLQQCGLTPWEIISARMYDPSLTPRDIEELQ